SEAELRPVLEAIRDAEQVDEERMDHLRTVLEGGLIGLADGSMLRIEHVAEEGAIRRVAGPDRTVLEGHEHTAADAVHIDQDVHGTPLRQLFSGEAPDFFCHDSPDGDNEDATHHLVNVWIPLRQVTRPLALMDGRSLDRPRHQLRYALPVDGFLDREDDATVNDIWQCLHDPAHRWWYRAAPALGDAYVFDTLSTPHTSFVLPGEDVAADRYRRLGEVAEAVGAGDLDQARRVAGETRSGDATAAVTTPLREAIRAMDGVLDQVDGLVPAGAEAWTDRAENAREAVVRRSLELRAVVTRIEPTG
ncbi:MAG: hypothetical protein AAGK32_15820, partial [Actinomycetota bacterium]